MPKNKKITSRVTESLVSSVPIDDYIPSLATEEIKTFLKLIEFSGVKKTQMSENLTSYLIEKGVIGEGEVDNEPSWLLTREAKSGLIYQTGLIWDLQELLTLRNEEEVKKTMREEQLGR